ncbi:MAG: hypothetical protein OWV35_08525, partial [Firmicutes bacterium]|nr:hypothetical protein [Bacillota bacterium]
MRVRTKALLAGAGILLAVGLAWDLSRTARPPVAPRPRPLHRSHVQPSPKTHATSQGKEPGSPQSVPALPVPGAAAGPATGAGATAAFEAVAHTAPPVPVEVVPSPATPGHWWAIEPMGVTTPGLSAPTLWSAYRSSTGRWHWTPTTWPNRVLVPNTPFREALQWAD